MEKKLKIAFVASEVNPFAKTGGLADVVGALPKALKRLGHDVVVIMPRYYGVGISKYNLKKIDAPLGVPMGVIGEQWCGVYEGVLPESEVKIYFLDHELYYGRDAIYNDESGEGFLDNDNRFVFLSRASLQLLKMIDFRADVVHANDWQSAAVPIFLNTIYKHDPFFKECSSVLTIHNMQHQGVFYEGLMDVLDIGWEHFNYEELEYKGQVNLLKGGIFHAHCISTVSKGYAEEIKTKEYGFALDGAIRVRGDDLYGIVNGIDYDEWNPSSDKYIASNYSKADLSGKKECKKALQKEFNLPLKEDVPLIGLVSRLVHQKGIDVIAEAIENILTLDVQVVFLGNGEPWSHFFFGDIALKYPEKFSIYVGYNNKLSHMIEAGSDLFLMPSRFEPCGLNQMYSLRYGTLPIVRATGGLNDTVENYDEQNRSGDGFKFYSLDANSLFNTVGWAVHTYYNKKEDFLGMIKRGMEKDFTWERSAKEYVQMYKNAINRKIYNWF